MNGIMPLRDRNNCKFTDNPPKKGGKHKKEATRLPLSRYAGR
jgi:hypothetical protein